MWDLGTSVFVTVTSFLAPGQGGLHWGINKRVETSHTVAIIMLYYLKCYFR